MRIRSWRWLLPLCVLAILVIPLAPAHADDGSGGDIYGGAAEKLLDYALCAVSIMATSTVIGGVVAGLTCAKAFVTWFTI